MGIGVPDIRMGAPGGAAREASSSKRSLENAELIGGSEQALGWAGEGGGEAKTGWQKQLTKGKGFRGKSQGRGAKKAESGSLFGRGNASPRAAFSDQ
jgi:hypothetical protein